MYARIEMNYLIHQCSLLAAISKIIRTIHFIIIKQEIFRTFNEFNESC